MTQDDLLAYSASRPGKRMSAACVFFNPQGEILIVKPTYRPEWLLPGGSMERDESPVQCCRREVHEELGISVAQLHLLCLEYQSAHPAGTESLMFIFYGGVLDGEAIQSIQLPEDEISDFRFCSRQEALGLLVGKLAERMVFAFKAMDEGRLIYLEDKREI